MQNEVCVHVCKITTCKMRSAFMSANYNVQNMICKMDHVLNIMSLRIASQVQNANRNCKVPTHRKFNSPYASLASQVQNANRSCKVACCKIQYAKFNMQNEVCNFMSAKCNVQNQVCKVEQEDILFHATPQMFPSCDSASVYPNVSPSYATELLPVCQIASWALHTSNQKTTAQQQGLKYCRDPQRHQNHCPTTSRDLQASPMEKLGASSSSFLV